MYAINLSLSPRPIVVLVLGLEMVISFPAIPAEDMDVVSLRTGVIVQVGYANAMLDIMDLLAKKVSNFPSSMSINIHIYIHILISDSFSLLFHLSIYPYA